MKWFGESWGAPICTQDDRHVELQRVLRCSYCKKDIDLGDQGVLLPFSGSLKDFEFKDIWYGEATEIAHLAYHLNCFLDDLGIRPKKKEEEV